jgi:hypothetical protein
VTYITVIELNRAELEGYPYPIGYRFYIDKGKPHCHEGLALRIGFPLLFEIMTKRSSSKNGISWEHE